MNEEDTDEKRRQRSDEARRAAMRQRIEQQRERERQIAADIANVDKKGTKRIVFEDSDNDDNEDGDPGSSSSSKRPKLFDSEDEDGEIEEIELKNRHSGPKGEKLMQLESRFNSDPRFKLDDKFAESDSDEDGNAVEDVEKQEMKQEKDKNRELLSKILGKSVEDKKPRSAETTLLKARPFTRFDPENPDHLAWMKAFEESKNPTKVSKNSENEEKSAKSDADDEENEAKIETEKGAGDEDSENDDDDNFEKAEIFFKMDEQFSTEMKDRKDAGESGTGGFSFLSMMGRQYDDNQSESSESETESREKKKEDIAETTKKEQQKIEKSLLNVSVRTKFFVDPMTDEKIRGLAANFRRTQTVEKVIDKWAPHRDAIFKLWKKQRRDALKVEKNSFFSGGKRKRKAGEENGEK